MIYLNFDGSCFPNPGSTSRYGFVIRRGSITIHEEGGPANRKGTESTNNIAEYTGLIKGLEWIQANDISEPVTALGDSQLVIRQLQGQYQVKAPALRPLYAKAASLVRALPNCTLRWIPREENGQADRLAQGA